MTKVSTKDWRNLPIEKWNTTSFHAFLIDRNRELYGIEYQPFGKGAVSKRWSQEKGQLKQACEKYGNDVIKRYIEKCFDKHRFNPKFPTLSFGFIFSYMRTELSQAENEVRKSKEMADIAERSDSAEIDEDWF